MAINLTDQYLDALNEAMEIHAKNAISNLNFNKTEVAEIINITDRDKGDYIVDNGSVKYHAYIENSSYTLGTKVYVLIQNNDYSQRKLILGKVKTKDDQSVDYVAPLSKYNPLTENLITDEDRKENLSSVELDGAVVNINYDNEKGTGLWANYNELEKKQGIQYDLLYMSKDLTAVDNDNQLNDYNQHFKYMGISAEFKTLLKQFNPYQGKYGLEIYIQYSKLRGGSTEDRDIYVRKYRFESSAMIGSIYDFSSYYPQEALFELESDEEAIVHKVSVFFFQDNDFMYKDPDNNDLFIPGPEDELLYPRNILIRNIGLFFGDDKLEDSIDDKVEIYTNNGTVYDSAQLNDKLIEKRIEVKWTHRNPETDLLEPITSFNKKVKTIFDVDSVSRISWYQDGQYSGDVPREDIQGKHETYERLSEILNKYQEAMPASGNWISKWQEKYDSLGLGPSNFQVKEAWNEFLASDDAEGLKPNDLTLDDMLLLVNELGLKSSKDYIYDLITATIFLTPTGLKSANSAITRTNTSLDKTLSISPTLAGTGWVPIDQGLNVRYIDFVPNRKSKECKIKCVIEYGPMLIDEDGQVTDDYNTESPYYHKIESNILVLTNLSSIPDPGSLDNSINIELRYDDNSDGVYPLYDGTSQKLKDSFEIIRKRSLVASLNSKFTGKSYINGQEIIIWRVPKMNTMINLAGTLTDEKEYVYIDGVRTPVDLTNGQKMKLISETSEGHDKYRSLLEEYNIPIDYTNFYYIVYDADDDSPARNYLRYYLQEDFIKGRTNNTVFCYIIKNNKVYTGNTTMSFSIKGSSGTDYTFVFSFGEIVDEDWNTIEDVETTGNILTVGEEYYHRIIFDLYDADGEKIDLTLDKKNEIIDLWAYPGNDQSGYYAGFNNRNCLQWLIDYDLGKVAVKLNPSITDIKDLAVVLQATVTSNATVAYNNRNYSLSNIDFTQCLPIFFRTNSSYVVSGTNVFYYDDNGELLQGSPTRYSLIGHDIDDLENKPDPSSIQQQIDEEENNILNGIEEIKQLLNISEDKMILYKLLIKTRIKVDDYGRITNFEELAEYLHDQMSYVTDELSALQAKLNNEYSHSDITFPGLKDVPEEELQSVVDQIAIFFMLCATTYLKNKLDLLVEYKKLSDEFDFEVSNFDGVFSVVVYDYSGNPINNDKELIYYPAVTDDIKHTVYAPIIYADNLSKEILLRCTYGGNVVYVIPLVMLQNKYKIPALNRWDGKLLIDADNNQIMAATIAAGHKENNNTFTGVIMGDVGVSESNYTTGLYGYHQGAQSFGWKADGTGFIGKSNTGRIEFDGNNGFIRSANYVTSGQKQGTYFNLNDGFIDMYGLSGNSKRHVQIGTIGTGAGRSYLRIAVPSTGGNGNESSDGLKGLIQIDDNNYYLQTADYGGSSGLRIDLKNGTFDSKGVLTINGAAGSSIDFGKFKADPSGGITATAGSIGDWTISSGSLTGGGITIASGGISNGENWGISGDGSAYFTDVTITGGKITGNSNAWDLSGNFDFGLGTISLGSMGYGSQGIKFGDGAATMSGTVYANAGKIGGWNIDSDSIDGGSTHLYTSGKIEMGNDLAIGGNKITFDGSSQIYNTANGIAIMSNTYTQQVQCTSIKMGNDTMNETNIENWKDMYNWYTQNKNNLATQTWVNNRGFLTKLPSHEHSVSGTDSLGGPISGTAK